jgi:uncharacterized membrane protein
MNALRTIFRWWVLILLIASVVQVGFAGIGAFDVADKATAGANLDEDSFYDSFTLHAILGTLIVLGSLLLFLLSLAARVGRQRILHSLGIFALIVVQMILGWSGQELPEVLGFLHPVNALVILAALGILYQRVSRGDQLATPVAPPPAAA